MQRHTVSAVIPTKNVAEIIRPTLDSLQFCDEVVVVDMFSTDATSEICKSYPNVRFFQRDDYIYGNFNYGVQEAQSDWIIRLDSDEVISCELKDSIIAVLDMVDPVCKVYDAQCRLYILGRELKHGFGSAWRTILFRKGHARYRVASEHEALTCDGSSERLRGVYEHFTSPTLSVWIQKLNYYSDRDVERVSELFVPTRFRMLYETIRLFQRLYLHPHWLCKDGSLGMIISSVYAFSHFLTLSKAWEKNTRA